MLPSGAWSSRRGTPSSITAACRHRSSRSAPRFARWRRPPGSRDDRRATFPSSRPYPGKDRRALPRLCRLHRLERASLRRNGVDLRARRDGREPQGAVLGSCGTGCCRSSMPRGPGPAALRFPVPGLPGGGAARLRPERSPRSSDTTSSAGVSTPRCIRSRCRSPATTCASPPVTTGTIFRPPCSARPTRSGMALYEQGVDPAYTRTTLATDLVGTLCGRRHQLRRP